MDRSRLWENRRFLIGHSHRLDTGTPEVGRWGALPRSGKSVEPPPKAFAAKSLLHASPETVPPLPATSPHRSCRRAPSASRPAPALPAAPGQASHQSPRRAAGADQQACRAGRRTVRCSRPTRTTGGTEVAAPATAAWYPLRAQQSPPGVLVGPASAVPCPLWFPQTLPGAPCASRKRRPMLLAVPATAIRCPLSYPQRCDEALVAPATAQRGCGACAWRAREIARCIVLRIFFAGSRAPLS